MTTKKTLCEATVMIVDDSEESVLALEMAIGALPGVNVTLVGSAAAALRRLEGGPGVCAVVTDLRMPGMDGYELIERIRSRSRIPIVVVSGDTDPGAPGRTSALGANAFFAKPFSPAAVCAAVEKLLNESRNA